MSVKFIFFILLIALFFAGCDNKSKESKIIKIANKYVAIKYPKSLSIIDKPIVEKKNNIWIVTYTLPKNTIGGAPIVYIDDNNYSVIRSYHGQ